MDKPEYIYDLDDHPPLRLALLYALQWAFIIFPVFIASAVLPARVLQLGPVEELRFLQLILLSSGFFTTIQCLWGHRYPLIEGPSTALLLTFIIIAPYGLPAVQAGAIAGGLLLMAAVIIVKPKRIIPVMTPNVVGVILMLISLSLLPYMGMLMSGAGSTAAGGSAEKFLLSVGLVLLMSTMAYRLRGFFKTLWLLLGMLIGTALFFALEHPSFSHLLSSSWLSIPQDIIPSRPQLTISAVVAFAVSYVAVAVNSIGSIQAIANLTNRDRLSAAIPRGLFINGVAGVFCGLMGIVGTVSYSMSPGIVLSMRVSSRFTLAWCGMLFILAAFIPKLGAFFTLVPAPVVGAALCTAMGIQIGAALEIIVNAGIEERSYYIVGLPVVLGTLIGFLPQNIVNELPQVFRVFLGNGLTFGILLVLFLEHVLMRRPPPADQGDS
ncbi:MAG: solute carrier family 23 protein [Syntrophobacteraceae bacterium]|jgi:uracil permease